MTQSPSLKIQIIGGKVYKTLMGDLNKLFVFKPKHFIIAPSNVCYVWSASLGDYVTRQWFSSLYQKAELDCINLNLIWINQSNWISFFLLLYHPIFCVKCNVIKIKDTDINQLKVAKFQKISSSASKLKKPIQKVAHILAIWILSLFLIWKYVVTCLIEV